MALQVQSPSILGEVKGTSKRGKKDPPPVQWDHSIENKHARLHELTDVNIYDIPVIMCDSTIFRNIHAQDKLANYADKRRSIFRPANGKEIRNRIEQAYQLKMHLRAQYQIAQTYHHQQFRAMDDGKRFRSGIPDSEPFAVVIANGDEEKDLGHISRSFKEEFRQIANSSDGRAGTTKATILPTTAKSSCGKRSSLSSLESLERRLAARFPQDNQELAQYSHDTLRTILFVKRRLSVGSSASKSSKMKTSPSKSRRTSWSSMDSDLTVTKSPSLRRSLSLSRSGSISRRDSTATIRTSKLSEVTLPNEGGEIECSQSSEAIFLQKPKDATGGNENLSFRTDSSSVASKSTSSVGISQECNTSRPRWARWQLRLKRLQQLPHNDPDLHHIATQILDPGKAPPLHKITSPYDETGQFEETLRDASIDGLFGLDELCDYDSFVSPNPSALDTLQKYHAERSDENFGTLPSTVVFRNPQSDDCCLDLRRGDPRASICQTCQLIQPNSHAMICSIIEAWQTGDNPFTPEKYCTSDTSGFDEVDTFHDTLLHTAGRHGAGSGILMWLIRTGVDVHAKNAAGQTFMHVLNPIAFNGQTKDIYHGGEEDFHGLLFSLQSQNFDFFHTDDYGQTPLHVLTQYWMHSDSIAAIFDCTGLTPTTKPLARDFRARTIDLQLKAQVSKEHRRIVDFNRQNVLAEFIHADTSGNDLVETGQAVNSGEAAPLQETIQQGLNGNPLCEYKGKNAFHCLAERSCLVGEHANSTIGLGSNTLKRKHDGDIPDHRVRVVRTVIELCAAGVDVNAYDIYGNTPIMAFTTLQPCGFSMAEETTSDILQTLIDNGASVHRRNRRGETALHVAMRLGRITAVDTLLKNHANIHVTSRKGRSVLDVANKALEKEKKDVGLCARITACINAVTKCGPVDVCKEWDEQMQRYKKGSE